MEEIRLGRLEGERDEVLALGKDHKKLRGFLHMGSGSELLYYSRQFVNGRVSRAGSMA